jgi:hypothetical protein
MFQNNELVIVTVKFRGRQKTKTKTKTFVRSQKVFEAVKKRV